VAAVSCDVAMLVAGVDADGVAAMDNVDVCSGAGMLDGSDAEPALDLAAVVGLGSAPETLEVAEFVVGCAVFGAACVPGAVPVESVSPELSVALGEVVFPVELVTLVLAPPEA
jgi:hypothetical protein